MSESKRPNWLRAQATPMQDIPAQEGREDAHGKHPLFSLRLELEAGDAVAVLYGTLLGGVYYNPSHGIQMVFESAYPKGWGQWEYGPWMLSIEGNNLKDIYNHLCESKEVFVREGESIRAISVVKAEIKGMK